MARRASSIEGETHSMSPKRVVENYFRKCKFLNGSKLIGWVRPRGSRSVEKIIVSSQQDVAKAEIARKVLHPTVASQLFPFPASTRPSA